MPKTAKRPDGSVYTAEKEKEAAPLPVEHLVVSCSDDRDGGGGTRDQELIAGDALVRNGGVAAIGPLTIACGGEIYEQVWGAGATLAAHLMSGPGRCLFDERPDVIELGSGTGVVGMAAAVAGASSVILTDLEEALPQLNATIHDNSEALSGADVRAAALPWGDVDAVYDVAPSGCDLIIGADLLYQPAVFDALLATLAELQQIRDARSKS
mmetsp:Transcript_17165/g.44637  ORF Transcript_17165/g.44637 Transcript_17165/m.44637 type:complete len:211 (-) Transcript_17165:2-634(-)